MAKSIKQKVNHVIDRLNFKFNYLLANTVMKRKVDAGNGQFKMMDDKVLVDEIVLKGKSYARFGDGELSLIAEEKFDLNFQYNSKELRQRLNEVLNSDLDNLIIGINRSLNDPGEYNLKVQKNCRAFNYLYRDKFKTIIPKDRVYGNSSITRFYIDYDNSDMAGAEERVANIRRIWEKRKLLIVEGIHSRLGVGNDLFENAGEIRRILVPETNAFGCYDEILEAVLKNVKQRELVLLAAGPAATILAYDLAKKNVQAVDVGHVDIEYEWMKMGVKDRVPVAGKYVNEIKGEKYKETSEIEASYEQSIIAKIG